MSDPISILVVDDNPSMTDTLEDILDTKGFEVHVAYSGMEALALLRAHKVDIMLTDVKMPDMNGVELYLETRKTHPTITTFLMTAYAADDLIQRGMKAGIKTVLNKPLDIDLLIAMFSAIGRINSMSG
jgi:DNA-binding response OmpR family regulator